MRNAVDRLRDYCQTLSTRSFSARGSLVVRCEQCHLAKFACLCPWQLSMPSKIEFILLMHRKEVYKTTNTGRLIADMFPDSTHAFLWDRTEPSTALVQQLNNKQRNIMIVFPDNHHVQSTSEHKTQATERETKKKTHEEKTKNNEHAALTVVLLDGTWKQASRMMRLSPWLQHLPRLALTVNKPKNHYIRQAKHQDQLATAQAAAYILEQHNETDAARCLEHYFSIFNQHCIATRRNITPIIGESHNFLKRRIDIKTCATHSQQ